MKAIYSEQYYRENWERYIKPVKGEHYINLEEELEARIEPIKAVLEGENLKKAIKAIAGIIAEEATRLVYKELEIIKGLEAGTASFGYTTEWQENEARFELRTRFEFNCLQLADFKKKYL